MAINFVGSAENQATNGADVTLTLPTTIQNDLVIVSYSVGDNDTVNEDMVMITADYTQVADAFQDDSVDTNLGVFWKIMGATPDTTAQVDGLGGTDASVAAVCMVFRGVDTATPMDVTPTATGGINTMHPDPPSIDHNNPTGVWTVIAGASGHVLGAAGTFTFPTGYTTNALEIGSDDTSDCTVGMGYRSSGVSDPENPGVMTHSGVDALTSSWCACTIALRPAPVLAVLTGTITAGVTEADIVAGGKTLIITLTYDTWIAAGAGSFDLQRDEIIAGCDSAQSEALGWDLVPKATQALAGVVRTSDTVVTITWDAFATYNITATETITVTVPSTAIVGAAGNVTATPTFNITAVGTAPIKQMMHHYKTLAAA